VNELERKTTQTVGQLTQTMTAI